MTQKFARLEKDIVMEVIELPDNVAVQKAFHPDVVAQLVEVPPEIRVAQGMIFLEQAGMFDDPPTPVPPALSKAEALAQSNVKMLRVVDELSDIVLQLATRVGGVKVLSPEAQSTLSERRTIITS